MRSFLFIAVLALSLLPLLAALSAQAPWLGRTAQAIGQMHMLTPDNNINYDDPLFYLKPLQTQSILQPSAVWATVVPLIPSYSNGRLFVLSVIAGVDIVLCLDPTSLDILRNYTLPANLEVLNLYTTQESLFLLAVDVTSDQYSVLQMSISTGKLVQTPLIMPYPLMLIGVDAAGQRLLTAVYLGSEVVVLSATTGERLGAFDGGASPLHVMGGGLHPTNGNMLVADRENKTVLVISPDNAIVSVMTLPSDSADFYSLSVDEDGIYAYALTDDSNLFFVIEQFKISTGLMVNITHIPKFASRMQSITASGKQGEVLATDVQRLTIDRVQSGVNDVVRSNVGAYPIMWYPSGLAVPSDRSSIYLATNSPPMVHELNLAGQMVSSFPTIDVSLCGSSYPASTVSVDSKGNVFIPQCNSTLLIYNANKVLLASIFTGKNTRPRSCAPTARRTAFITDDNNASMITELDIITGKHVSILQGGAGAAFFDVAVDIIDGSVWASDAAGMSVYHWAADGTLLSKFDVSSSGVHSQALYDIAVDPVHSHVIVTKSVVSATKSQTSYILWLDAHTGAVVDTYIAAGLAVALAVSPDGRTLYATDHDALAVLLFDQKKATTMPTVVLSE